MGYFEKIYRSDLSHRARAVYMYLNQFVPPDYLTVNWNRSGHCGVAYGYQVGLEGHSILFSGDYPEHTLTYTADLI